MFQNIAPLFLLATPTYAQVTPVVSDVSLSFNSEQNQLSLKGSVNTDTQYLLTYDDIDEATPPEAITGSVNGVNFEENIFVGTCSGEDCVEDEVTKGSLEFTATDYTADYQITDGVLWLTTNNVSSVAQVELNKTYQAPQNNQVSVTFTSLPENPGSLNIEEIILSEEQVESLGALSNVAYDITSSMEDGSFEYDLTLPLPEGADETAKVVYAENIDGLASGEELIKTITGDEIKAEGVDHFTVFVVTFETPQDPSPSDPGYNDIWLDFGGTITQVPTGTNGITSAEGNSHAEITGSVFTRWDGYKSDFPIAGYDTSLDVFLDMNLADGIVDKRFDFSSAISNPAGSHRRDFIIHLGTNPNVSGQWLVNASNNAPGWPGNSGSIDVTESGWYTIEHKFRENSSGVLEVTVSLYKKGETSPVGSWLLSNPTDIIGDTVGGNRYGWFTSQRFDFDWLAIDNTKIDYATPTITTIEVPLNSGNWLFNRDLDTATPYEFNVDQASIGIGSLYVKPIQNNYPVAGKAGNDKFIAENFLMTEIDDVDSVSYDFMIGAGGDSSDANEFYMNVYANFGDSDPNKYYDCKYDVVPAIGSTAGFTTVTFDPTQSYPVTTRTGGSASPYSCPSSPSEMNDLSTEKDSVIRMFALNLGDTSSNDTNLDGYFDNVIINKGLDVTIYDFEPDLTPPAAPKNLGFNSRDADFSTEPVEISCGGATDLNQMSHHWTIVDDAVKYQRQWVFPGNDTQWKVIGKVQKNGLQITQITEVLVVVVEQKAFGT